jgi:methionine sulfoxide reductase heme-binding subunit
VSEPIGGDAAPSNEGASFAPAARAQAARLAAALAALALLAVALLALSEPWPPARALVLARGSGWSACGALLISLALTAVSRIAGVLAPAGTRPWPIPAPVLRRAFGMTAAWLGAVHALIAVLGPLDGSLRALLLTAHLIAGLSALALLALLLLTSFAAVVQRLRLRSWKELHRLSYAAALLVAQHVLLAPFVARRVALGLLAAVLVLIAARLLPRVRRVRS